MNGLDYRDLARRIAEEEDVYPPLVEAIISQESGWNPGAVSHRGAMGLMQLMPGTASDLDVGDPYDPEQNIRGGVRYLRQQFDRFGDDIPSVLAAYNAGPTAVAKYGGVPPYRETQAYIDRVSSHFLPRYQREYDASAPASGLPDPPAPDAGGYAAPSYIRHGNVVAGSDGKLSWLSLPDGTWAKAPTGMDETESLALARERYPEAFRAYEAVEYAGGDSSTLDAFWATASRASRGLFPGIKMLYADMAGDEEMFDSAAQELSDATRAAGEIAPNLVSLEEIKGAYEKDGLMSAVSKFFEFGSEQVGSSFGFQAPSLAAGLGGYALGGALAGFRAAAPLAWNPAAAATTGILAGLGTMWATFLSENLERAYDEGAKDIEELSLLKSAAAAGGQTALNSLGYMLLGGMAGVRGLASGSGFRESQRMAAGSFAKMMDSLNEKGVITRIAAVVAEEEVAELGQQALERFAAGLPVSPTEKDAMDEYVHIMLATLAPSVMFGGLGAGATKWSDRKRRKFSEGIEKSRKELEGLRDKALRVSQEDESRSLEELATRVSVEQQAQEERLANEALVSAADTHRLADDRNIRWDDDPGFLSFSERVTSRRGKPGKFFLDDMNQEELSKVYTTLNRMPAQVIPTSLSVASLSKLEGSVPALSRKGEGRQEVTKKLKKKLKLDSGAIPEDTQDKIAEAYLDRMLQRGLISLDKDKGFIPRKRITLPRGELSSKYKKFLQMVEERGRLEEDIFAELGIRDEEIMERMRERAVNQGRIRQDGRYIFDRDEDVKRYGIEVVEGRGANRRVRRLPESYRTREEAVAAQEEAYRGPRTRQKVFSVVESIEPAGAVSGFQYEVDESESSAWVVRDASGNALKVFPSNNKEKPPQKAERWLRGRNKKSKKWDVVVDGAVASSHGSAAAANVARKQAREAGATNAIVRPTAVDPGLRLERQDGFVLREAKVREQDGSLSERVPVEMFDTRELAQQAASAREEARAGRDVLGPRRRRLREDPEYRAEEVARIARERVESDLAPEAERQGAVARDAARERVESVLGPAGLESLTEEQGQVIESVEELLSKTLTDRIGKRVLVQIVGSLKSPDGVVAADFVSGLSLIRLALDGHPDLLSKSVEEQHDALLPYLTHESVHALRQMGAISQSEWRNLSSWVKKTPIDDASLRHINSRISKGPKWSKGTTWDQFARSVYAEMGRRDKWVADEYTEEAIAIAWQYDQLARKEGRSQKRTPPSGLLERFLDILRRIRSALFGKGWANSDEIFEAMYGGTFGKRVEAGLVLDDFWASRRHTREFADIRRMVRARAGEVTPMEVSQGWFGPVVIHRDLAETPKVEPEAEEAAVPVREPEAARAALDAPTPRAAAAAEGGTPRPTPASRAALEPTALPDERPLEGAFFSALGEALRTSPQRSMSLSELKAYLKKKRVKQEEIEWSNLEDFFEFARLQHWLASNPDTRPPGPQADMKLDLDTLMEQIKLIKVEEVVLGGEELPEPDLREIERTQTEEQREVGGYDLEVGEWHSGDQFVINVDPDAGNVSVQGPGGRFLDVDAPINNQTEQDGWDAIRAHIATQTAEQRGGFEGAAQHEGHTLPGGENYREYLITLPMGGVDPDAPEVAAVLERTDGGFNLYDPGRDTIFNRYLTREEAHAAARAEGWNPQDEAVHAVKSRVFPGTFTGGHFGDVAPNVLVHARVKDRVGPNGERILFIEEIQDDWAKAGREKGYALPEERIRYLEARREELERIGGASLESDKELLDQLGIDTSGNRVVPAEVRQEWVEVMNELQPESRHSRVLDRPFKASGASSMLALKRMIAKAAKEGYDSVAWTTGKIQVDRYQDRLRQSVDAIQWSLLEGEGFTGDDVAVTAVKDDAHVIDLVVSRETGLVNTSSVEGAVEKPLESVVGKEIAAKILGETEGEVSGDDLTIGGKGFEDLYDGILVRGANKLGKKFGAKVGRRRLLLSPLSESGPFIHTFPITSKLRESIKKEGLPLFGTDASRYALDPGESPSSELIMRPGESGTPNLKKVTWGTIFRDRYAKPWKQGNGFRVLVPEGSFNSYGKLHMDRHNKDIQDHTIYTGWEELLPAMLAEMNNAESLKGGEVVVVSSAGDQMSVLWQNPQFRYPVSLTLQYFKSDKSPEGGDSRGDYWFPVTVYADGRHAHPLAPISGEVPLHGPNASARAVMVAHNNKIARRFTKAQASRYSLSGMPSDATPASRKSIDVMHGGRNVIPRSTKPMRDYIARVFDGFDEKWRMRARRAWVNKYAAIEAMGRELGLERPAQLMADVSAHVAAQAVERANAFVSAMIWDGGIHWKKTSPMEELGDTELVLSGFARVEEMALDHELRVTRGPDGRESGGAIVGVDRVTREFKRRNVSDPTLYDGIPGLGEVVLPDGTVKKTGGAIPIMLPLNRNPGNKLFDAAIAYMRAIRVWRLIQEGNVSVDREEYPDADLIRTIEYADAHPEIAIVAHNLQKWNDTIVDFLENTEVLTPEMAAKWKGSSDYIPFYLEVLDEGKGAIKGLFMDELGSARDNAYMERLLTGIPSPKITGAAPEEKLMAPIEALLKNAQMMVHAGLKNVAVNRSINEALELGLARKVDGKDDGEYVVSARVNGEVRYYDINDPLLHETLVGFFDGDSVTLGRIVRIVGVPSRILREAVTRTPGFMFSNLERDSLSVWAMGGGSRYPIVGALRRFASQLLNMRKGEATKTYVTLGRGGAIGGFELAGADPRKMKRMFAGKVGANVSPLRGMWRVWDALGEMSARSEASTRELVFEDTFLEVRDRLEKEGYSRGEAEFRAEAQGIRQAQEVLNFGRRGNSGVAKLIAAALPFSNARLQGLDRLFRVWAHGDGPNGKMDRDTAVKILGTRMLFLSGLTMGYALLTYDDEDFKKVSQEARWDNWLLKIPGTSNFIAIPIPFEVGVLTKGIPEALTHAMIGAVSDEGPAGRDVISAMKHHAMASLAINPVPQAFRPALEAYTNYNFFTGQPIVPAHMKGLPEYQYRLGTTTPARWMGKALGVSPLKVENTIRGYFGTMGMWALDATDWMANSVGFGLSSKPLPRWSEAPVIRRFFKTGLGRGLSNEYYDFSREVGNVTATIRKLRKEGRTEEAREVARENEGMLRLARVKKVMDKKMSRLREIENSVRMSDMDWISKRERLDQIQRRRNELLKGIPALRSGADMPLF